MTYRDPFADVLQQQFFLTIEQMVDRHGFSRHHVRRMCEAGWCEPSFHVKNVWLIAPTAYCPPPKWQPPKKRGKADGKRLRMFPAARDRFATQFATSQAVSYGAAEGDVFTPRL